MKIRDFGLEIFFGRYEFSAPYLLAQSDCESLSIRELLALEPGSQEGFLDTWLGYSENDGAPALREAVSGLYAQCGPENVLLHVGAQEAIFGALNVLVEPGEHVDARRDNSPPGGVITPSKSLLHICQQNYKNEGRGNFPPPCFYVLRRCLVNAGSQVAACSSCGLASGFSPLVSRATA